MSGGSFNYLTFKSVDEVIVAIHDLDSMAALLAQEFPGSRAAEDTRVLLEHLKTLQDVFHDGPTSDLRGSVWKAMEWWQSGDSSREKAAEAVARYDAGRTAFDPMPHEQDRLIEVRIGDGAPGKLAAIVDPPLAPNTTHATAVMDGGVLGPLNVHIEMREMRK